MSLRKSKKTGAAKTAAKAVTLIQIAKPVAGAVKSFRRARAGKSLRQSNRGGSGRRPGVFLIGLLGLGGVAAAVAKKRAGTQDLGYGPPNESVPSHETLAPAKAATGQATNGESGAGESGSESAGSESAGSESESAGSDTGGPPGDDAGTDEPGREETAEQAS
jgi:hypothetical protein